MIDKNIINARILALSKAMDNTKEKHELLVAEESNTHLQDFVIWLKGYLDGKENSNHELWENKELLDTPVSIKTTLGK